MQQPQSSRVKGRKFRPIDAKNRLHRLGNSNTTGTYGNVSTWNVRVSHSRKLAEGANPQRAAGITVETGLPGKRRACKRKRTALVCTSHAPDRAEINRKVQLRNLRNDLHTAALIGQFAGRDILPPHAVGAMAEITHHLLILLNPGEKLEMERADRARFYSIKGMVEKKQMTGEPIKRLWERIDKALKQVRPRTLRGDIPHTFKPEPQKGSFYVA